MLRLWSLEAARYVGDNTLLVGLAVTPRIAQAQARSYNPQPLSLKSLGSTTSALPQLSCPTSSTLNNNKHNQGGAQE